MHLKQSHLALMTILLVGVSPSVSAKCAQWPISLSQAFDGARDVVLVEIGSAAKSPEKTGEIQAFKATYELIESFKGSNNSTGEVIYRFEPHSILLTPGLSYLFFLSGDNQVSICRGSRRFEANSTLQTDEEKKELTALRKLRDENI